MAAVLMESIGTVVYTCVSDPFINTKALRSDCKARCEPERKIESDGQLTFNSYFTILSVILYRIYVERAQ